MFAVLCMSARSDVNCILAHLQSSVNGYKH